MKLTPTIFNSMSPEAQEVLKAKNLKLWQVVKAVFPNAAGDLDTYVDAAIDRIEQLQTMREAFAAMLEEIMGDKPGYKRGRQ